MSKTVIDIDDDLVAEAADVLDTSTKEDTANSLKQTIAESHRVELIEHFASDPYPDLRDPEIMKGAWR